MADVISLDAANAEEDAFPLPSTITDPLLMTAHDTKIVSARFVGKLLFENLKAMIDGRVSSRAYRNAWTGSGITAGEPLRISAADTVIKATATTEANARVFAFARYVTGSTVYVEHFRRITGLSGGTAGGDVFLTDAGSFSATPGTYRKRVGIWEDTTTAILFATPDAADNDVANAFDPAAVQARLTLTAGTPVTTADVTGATTIYLSPYNGNRLPLFDGARWKAQYIREFGIALGTLADATKPYDIFAFTSSATPSSTDTGTDIVTFGSATGWQTGAMITVQTTVGGLTAGTSYWWNAASSTTGSFHTTLADSLTAANKVNLTASITSVITAVSLELLVWTSTTVRATALTTQDGIYVKSGATTRRHIGSFFPASATTMEDSAQYRYVWNRYNQVHRTLLIQDNTNSWALTAATGWQQANASSINRVGVMNGDVGTFVKLDVNATSDLGAAEGGVVGIGLGNTTNIARNELSYSAAAGDLPFTAQLEHHPAVGLIYYWWIERALYGDIGFLGDNGGSDFLAGMGGFVVM